MKCCLECCILLLTIVLTLANEVQGLESRFADAKVYTDLPFIEDAFAEDYNTLYNNVAEKDVFNTLASQKAATYSLIAPPIHPDILADAQSTTYQLIRRHGYPAEVHTFTNRDGYVLEMHRIPGSPSSPKKYNKPVVYLQHGLFDSSATWVLMGPEKSLGYMLADLGYDVWLGNKRGNRYSRNHIKYNPSGLHASRKNFWDFSWHEMGIGDLPEMIDFITFKTGQKRMHYVGHSQGTTAYFVMCSEMPSFNDRIISAHMLAPIAFMGNLQSKPVQLSSYMLNEMDLVTKMLGMYEFLPNSKIMSLMGEITCKDKALFQNMCGNILFLLGGYSSEQLNYTMLPVIMGHTPAGASTRQLIHYGQGVQSKKFRQYDYGAKNSEKYGNKDPPDYNLDNIRAPITLYYSDNDLLSEPIDVETLFVGINKKTTATKILVNDPHFNHFDYVWGIGARRLVYDKVVSIMKHHESESGENEHSPDEL